MKDNTQIYTVRTDAKKDSRHVGRCGLGYTLLYIVGLSGIGNILANGIVAAEDFKLLTVLSHWPVAIDCVVYLSTGSSSINGG